MTRRIHCKWLKKHKALCDRMFNCLTYAGFWCLEPTAPLYLRYAYFVYNKVMLGSMVLFAMTLFADMCSNINNLSIITDDGCVFAGICVVIFKTFVFQFRREKIVRLIEETLICGEELCNSSIADIRGIVQQFLLRSMVSFYGFFVLGIILLIALIFFSPEGSLPIRAKYPVDITQTPWHEFSFTLELFALTGGILSILNTDSLVVTHCNILIMISEALNINFENCKDRGKISRKSILGLDMNRNNMKQNENNVKNRSSDFATDYKFFLQFHQRLSRALIQHNKIFCWSMLVQLISSTLIICLTGFQATVVKGQSSDVLKFGIYLMAAVAQLLYACWLGNELLHSFSCVDRSQWLSSWHCEPIPDVARLMVLSTMFSRQLFCLKAGGFYTVSLDTFVKIMKGSYSVFALLNKIHLDEHD